MTKRLTAVSVENVKPAATRREVPDAGCTGLYLIVQPSGNKSWAVRYRYEGRPRKLTLDGAPSLAIARKRATEALEKVERGIDPAAEKQQEQTASEEARALLKADTVEHWVGEFIRLHVKVKNKSWKQQVWLFERHVLPAWKDRTIHDVTRRDVNALLREIAHGDPPRPILANRVLSAVGKFFNWLVAEDVINVSPARGVAQPGKENRRERVLDDPEIAALWRGTDKLGEPYGQFVKLLLLTGQRRTEVSAMTWAELDLNKGIWTLPSERTKNGKQHTIPLAQQAINIINSITRIGDRFVFTVSGENPIQDFSRIKSALDRHAKLEKPWVLHDARRSVVTGMADIGVAPHIIEAVINHISGHRAGVAGIYNRSTYAVEKATALQRWADHVEQLITGKPADVIPFGRGGRR